MAHYISVKNSISIEDTITVVRNFLRVGKINEALENLQLIMESSDINERHELIIDILNIRILMELGQNEEASALVEASSYGLKSDRFKPEFIEIQTIKAMLYFLSSKFDESELILAKTFAELEKFNESDQNLCGESNSELNNLRGLMQSNKGNWNNAYVEFQNALGYRKRLNHRKEMGMIYFNLANVYRYQEKFQQSISSLEEAIRTFKDVDYVEGLEAAYNTIKDVFTEYGELDTAYLYKQKLDDLSEKINFKNYVKEATILKNSQAREIERLNAEIIKNKQEVWSLKLELNSIHDAKHDGESFSAQIVDKTKEELEEAKSEITVLRQENESLQTRIESQELKQSSSDDTERKLADSLDQIKTLTEHANHKTKEIENLNILVGKKKSELDEMQNVIDEYQGKVENLESESDSKNAELETLKEELLVKENTAGPSSTELQDAKVKIAELQIDLEDKEIEMKKLSEGKSGSADLSDELNVSKEKITELQTALDDKEVEMKKLLEDKSMSADLSDELNMSKEKIAELQTALDDKETEMKMQMKKETPSESDELKKAKEEITQLQGELKEKEAQMEENLNQMEITYEEIGELKSRLKSKGTVSSVDKAPVSSDKETEEVQRELKISKLENEVLERKIKDIEAKHKVDLQNTIDEMKQVSQDLSKSSMGDQVESLNEEIKILKNDLQEKEMEIENSSSKSNELNNKFESMELEIQKLKRENEKLLETSSKLDQYKAQIEELKSVRPSTQKIDAAAASTPARSSSAPPTLQDYIESSKLAENIASIMENQDSLKLRFLAMQIGTSPAKCMAEIKVLREIGFVDLEYDSAGDSNPLIVKK